MKLKDIKPVIDSKKNLMIRKKSLTSLEGFPKEMSNSVDLSHNSLETLEEIKDCVINGDFRINFNKIKNLNYLPQVNQSIRLAGNQLKNLEGSPKIVNGSFDVSYNKLISLTGSPDIIQGDFICGENQLTNLKYCPKEIQGRFHCSNNKITSLKYFPKKVGSDILLSNNQLTSLDGLPKKINGYLICKNNKLTSLENTPKEIEGVFDCKDNYFLKNVKQQIIENQIKAIFYRTDEGDFHFEVIEKEFNELKNKLLDKNLKKINEIDYGLSLS